MGPRDDVAHFAHYVGCRWDDVAGQVLIARLNAGWSWCIPLKDRLSVGIVLGHEEAARLGRTPAERLARAIDEDPWLSTIAGKATPVTSVATYSNYQLVSERGYGPGWVMVGDTFGFVDPMLSPGVFLALRSAEMVADALSPLRPAGDGPAAGRAVRRAPPLCRRPEPDARRVDGAGRHALRRPHARPVPGRPRLDGSGHGAVKSAAQHHIERHIALQASGAATLRRYSRGLLRFMGRHGLRGVRPPELAIR